MEAFKNIRLGETGLGVRKIQGKMEAMTHVQERFCRKL